MGRRFFIHQRKSLSDDQFTCVAIVATFDLDQVNPTA